MIWRDSVRRTGLGFLSLYSTTLLDVTGEDCRAVSLEGRLYKVLNAGVPIIAAHVALLMISFIKIFFHFLRINVLQLEVGFFSLFRCEIKLINRTHPFYSSLPGVIVEGAVHSKSQYTASTP